MVSQNVQLPKKGKFTSEKTPTHLGLMDGALVLDKLLPKITWDFIRVDGAVRYTILSDQQIGLTVCIKICDPDVKHVTYVMCNSPRMYL